jgi:peptide chain release factor 1
MKLDQLEKFEARYRELEELLGSPEVATDREKSSKFAKELADLREPVSLYRRFKQSASDIEELQAVLKEKHDSEFMELARKELVELEVRRAELEGELKKVLAGEDKDAGRDVIIEIRQGTGGDEAGLFAADLYRMYAKYASSKNWAVEQISGSTNDSGGFKEVIFSVQGRDAYRRLKFESGVHRVQRVPTTEAQGRVHTSTASVVVLVEPEEVDLVIEPKDLRIDTYRSSGPGGQHMQKTDSAVRITHIPTGVVVACQDERSQIKNKSKAMKVLRAKLFDMKRESELKKISQERRTQIGTGDRSEKIRTYNFPDRRVTDHRINFTSHQLEGILEGGLDEFTDALIKAEQEKKEQNA